MPVVRVEKWGDNYRLSELFSNDSNSAPPQPIVHEPSKNEEDLHYMEEFYRPENAEEIEEKGRFLSSVIRARSRVRELAMCQHWDYFITLTLDETKQDRFDIADYIKKLGYWIQNYNKKFGIKLQYLIIPEQHKNGAWHAHGLLRGVAPDSLCKNEHGYLDMPYYRNRFGYISLGRVKSHERCASYITKYISKDVKSTSEHMKKGAHLFYASRGLKGKEILWVATTPQHIQGGYKNEYGIFKWVKWDEARRYIDADVHHRGEILHNRQGNERYAACDSRGRDEARGEDGGLSRQHEGRTRERPQVRARYARPTRRFAICRGRYRSMGKR